MKPPSLEQMMRAEGLVRDALGARPNETLLEASERVLRSGPHPAWGVAWMLRKSGGAGGWPIVFRAAGVLRRRADRKARKPWMSRLTPGRQETEQ